MYDELKIGYFCFSDSAKICDEKKTNPTTRIAILKPEVFLITVFHSDEIFYSRNSNLSNVKDASFDVTMNANGWTGDRSPYSYTITNTKILATSNVDISPRIGCTNAQILAFSEGGFGPGSLAAGSVTISCYGKKPSIDLPITVIVRGKE